MNDNYENLKRVLNLAFDQAASGKGSERHAKGRRFEEQPIFKITDLVGVGFQAGQAIKKIQEAVSMMERGEYAAAEKEFFGAIVYTAAAVITSEKKRVGETNLKRQEPQVIDTWKKPLSSDWYKETQQKIVSHAAFDKEYKQEIIQPPEPDGEIPNLLVDFSEKGYTIHCPIHKTIITEKNSFCIYCKIEENKKKDNETSCEHGTDFRMFCQKCYDITGS